MDIDYLREFIELAKDGNFTRAARTLHISQPTLSKHIAVMESTFGIRVFDRNNLGTSLTSAGSMLFEDAQNVIDAYDTATAHMDRYRRSESLRLNIELFRGYKPTDDLLVSACQRLRQEGRTIAVQVTDILKPPLDELKAGSADIGLLVHPDDADLAGLISTPLVTEPLVAVVSKNHPLASRDFIQPSDLDGNVVWTIRDKGSLQFALGFEQILSRHGAHPHYQPGPWQNAQSSYTNLAFAGSGISVTFASVAKFAMPLTWSSYKVLHFEGDKVTITVNAVRRADDPNPAVPLLISCMEDIAASADMSAYWK